ncbi:pyridoxal phosphate-dependent transferase [Aspergillus caelatus]|uniref:Pyridoxal phosphate-dependent transferase n=1 Tax=Aspergillus caelatus TaxID=61420 RepID=A0A5N6ZKH3_9EURO|nr:pyridoxal phosphate-dependent transferase [Aspergillus caelatus]KAE8357466.1 pyridoxal phosphate-dependent transferase [Aspergillus caelatus]
MMTDDRLEHAKIGSWFLGPRAENHEQLKAFLAYILEKHREARSNIYIYDPDFITPEMQRTQSYHDSINRLWRMVKFLTRKLASHSIPFWSPRYNAHMNMDTAMPGIIGYMAAMLYNPNNAAPEGSPLTTLIERKVGQELCQMLGYRTERIEQCDTSCAWGHITCDGSVANLEAIWAARNLKFYPLSLKLAMETGNRLDFLGTIEPPFTLENCKGTKKLFKELSTWELLNLKPSITLDIPTRLYKEYGISPSFLESAIGPYLVQSIGIDPLEKKFNIKNSAKFCISIGRHYSWPKGGALIGIGSESFVNINVDLHARMNIQELKRYLDSCVPDAEDDRTPVFGVVAIMGSTEHGACDPLKELVGIRESYEEKGLSFLIHCDAAWGGYFTSMLRTPTETLHLPYVPIMALKPHTEEQLRALKDVDSITVDPHKSGYVNYPAGGLCYRDERLKCLITWTSPIVFHAGDALESMGVYGVEGSKPGASPVAAWLTHNTLKLNSEGYGRLLGEAIFTCSKLYCHWATMTREDTDLIVVPFNMLPTEQNNASPEAIEKEKTLIEKRILGVSNEDLMRDSVAADLLKDLGSDLMINAFACNFRVDGEANTDVEEANYLNKRIFKRLSVSSMYDAVEERPLFITESTFAQDVYGDCLRNYKRRLQLGETAGGDLVSLVNVTMSPWPSDYPFLRDLAETFKRVANQEVQRCVKRNRLTKDIHGFIMQGCNKLFLVHLSMFNMANHRRQLIVTAEIPERIMSQYRNLRAENPAKFYRLTNVKEAYLEELQHAKSFEARMDEGTQESDTAPLATFNVKNVNVVIDKSLKSDHLEKNYPKMMPFYVYGSEQEYHIDHVLKKSPNAQLTADCVTVSVKPPLETEQLERGVVARLRNVFERPLQPLPTYEGQIVRNVPGLSFVPHRKYEVEMFDTYANFQNQGEPIATGNIMLGYRVYADWLEINKDPTETVK